MFQDGRAILVVDNLPERRARVACILADEGFAVTPAGEGLSALRALAAQRYSLIIASAGLPGSLDGAATVRRARQRQPWLKALFIAEAAGWQARGNPDTDDVIAAPFERWEVLGCTFELLQRQTLPEATDLARSIRAERRVS
jgi:CheY-like chemotaxis protein